MGEDIATLCMLNHIDSMSCQELAQTLEKFKREHPEEYEKGRKKAHGILEFHKDNLYFRFVREKHRIRIYESLKVECACVLQELNVIGYL